MKKNILFIALVFILVLIGFNYVYKADRNISEEQPKFKISSDLLKHELNTNQNKAVTKYLNKTIEVTGKATQIEQHSIILNQFIYTHLDTLNIDISVDDILVIKGRFIGYDELLEEFKLDQCTVVSKQ
jgi:uncharacterized protein YxeA